MEAGNLVHNAQGVIVLLQLLAASTLAYASVQDSEAIYTANVEVSETDEAPFFTLPLAKGSEDGLVTSLANELETSESVPALDKAAPYDALLSAAHRAASAHEQHTENRAGDVKLFKDKMLVRVHAHPDSAKTIDTVMVAIETHAHLSEDRGLDVWSEGPGYMDIMVSQKEADSMAAAGHKVDTLINDVQQLIDDGSKVGVDVHPLGTPLDLDKPPKQYLRLADLHKFYKDLAESNLIQTNAKWLPSVGKSVEGRDIGALHFGGKNSDDIVFFQAGIHAREWISPSTVLHITHRLLTSTDSKIRALVDDIGFVVVPCANPDGYEYTHMTNRLWRKNRGDYGACKGVDLNRNWDDHWGQAGASHNPCSETFAGPSAFSEKETQVGRDLLLHLAKEGRKNIKGAIDWHSYSQIVLRPYDWAKPFEHKPKNEQALKQLGEELATIMTKSGNKGRVYKTEHASELYRVAGSTMAWHYAVITKGGAAYTVELPDKGRFGFVLPATEIEPVAAEVFPAVLHFAETLVQHKFTAAYTSMHEDHLLTETETLLEGLDTHM